MNKVDTWQIIDNRQDRKLAKIFEEYCKDTKELKIAVGYFYVSGFDLVKEHLKKVNKIQMIIGAETDLQTSDQIKLGHELKKYIKKHIMLDIHGIPKNNIDSLNELYQYIEKRVIDIRVYTKPKFHAKAYIFSDRKRWKMAIVGSSNFSLSGLGHGKNGEGNTELNSKITSEPDVEYLIKWYDTIWNEADDYNEDILDIIKKSPPFIGHAEQDIDYVSPLELFKTIAYEIFDQNSPDTTGNILTEFQQIGVLSAQSKISKYRGCIVADAVGLGKTFIAMALIIEAQNSGRNVLLIVPARLKDNWNDEMYYNFPETNTNTNRLHIMTLSELSRLDLADEKHVKKIEQLKKNYDYIVIDESHRLRNSGTFNRENKTYSGNRNYANLVALNEKSTINNYVLLTATPLNNSVNDLENIISLFSNESALKTHNPTLKFTSFKNYNKLQKKIKKIQKNDPRELNNSDIELLANYEEKLKIQIDEIKEILEEVMILRTRTDIAKKYPGLKIAGKSILSKTPTLESKRYEIGQNHIDMYNEIENLISELSVPHISIKGNKTASTNLLGLFKIHLFKRLESSIYSFFKSLEYLQCTEIEYKKLISSVGWRSAFSKKLNEINLDDHELVEYMNEVNTTNEVNQEYDDEDICQMFDNDLMLINSFVEKHVNKLKQKDMSYNDPKLDKLKEIINELPKSKILIFTQYVDTVRYLYKYIKPLAQKQNRNIDCVIGGKNIIGSTLDTRQKISRFAPIANHNQNMASNMEIDILITTDTLSEGVNLQDCSFIINYDLPWNPMRMVQRVGRVDRIGSISHTQVYNILPDNNLETLLHLLEKLESKIENIALIVGKENQILTEDEQINSRTIGEKIKNIENITDYNKYIEYGKTQFAKGFEPNDKYGEEMMILQNIINEYKISNFIKRTNPVYSIIQNNSKQGVFVMFRIYEKQTNVKLKNIILCKDIRTNKINEIKSSDEIILNMSRNVDSISKKHVMVFDLFRKDIEKEFANNIFAKIKNQYRISTMIDSSNASRTQIRVLTHLERISKNYQTTLSESKNQVLLKKATKFAKKFREHVIHDEDVSTLKSLFTMSDFDTTAPNYSDQKFLIKVEEFITNYMYTTRYSESINMENVAYKVVCRGACI